MNTFLLYSKSEIGNVVSRSIKQAKNFKSLQRTKEWSKFKDSLGQDPLVSSIGFQRVYLEPKNCSFSVGESLAGWNVVGFTGGYFDERVVLATRDGKVVDQYPVNLI